MRHPRLLLGRFAAWLGLVALCLRLATPALHDHAAHGHVPAGPVQLACACGHVHAADVDRSGERRAPVTGEAPAPHGPCIACELELAAPGTPVPLPVALSTFAPRCGAVSPRPVERIATAHRVGPGARAPPRPATAST